MKKYSLALFVFAILLSACTGTPFLSALWGNTFDSFDRRSLDPDVTAVRELSDGSIRTVYHRDLNTIVVDTHDRNGTLLDRIEFQHVIEMEFNYSRVQKPIFTSDNSFYWVDQKYSNSIHIDIQTQILSPLPEIPNLPEDQEVGIYASTLLDNGQLVLVGSERHRIHYGNAKASVVTVDAAGNVESATNDTLLFYTNVIPVVGTDQYIVQSKYWGPEEDTHRIYLADGVVLERLDSINEVDLLYADTQGIWFGSIEDNISYLNHARLSGELNWRWEKTHPRYIASTQDGYYVTAYSDYNKGEIYLDKIDESGNQIWSIPFPKGYYPYGLLVKDNKILISEGKDSQQDSFVFDATVTPIKTIETTNRNVEIRHKVLSGFDGNEISRFKESEYSAIYLRGSGSSTFLSLLEFTPGSCKLQSLNLLNDGAVATITSWCSDRLSNHRQYHLSYFQSQ